MQNWPITRHNWHEPTAYLFAAISLIGGVFLAFTGDPDWVGRSGSLVICIGVLLAASRKVDRQEEASTKHQTDFKTAMRPHIAGVLRETQSREPSFPEVHAAEMEINASVPEDKLPSLFKAKRRALRMHEVTLVIAGTLVNGFGPWLYRCAA